ncbi:MAG: TlpA family protein disulfide reductase [Deltaproteobacteria bacterium]|nr:TlpA family protein disulfide reductase [Deltaproteobacteria bacterium]
MSRSRKNPERLRAPYWLATALAALLICGAAGPARALVKPGYQLPAIQLPDTKGAKHDLAAMVKGKVALIVYWSVSCPRCREELPQIELLAKGLMGNPFVLVMVCADPPAMAPAVEAYAAEQKMAPPLLLDAGPDDSQPLGEALDIIATPGAAVLNPQGKVTFIQEYHVDMPALEKAIQDSF